MSRSGEQDGSRVQIVRNLGNPGAEKGVDTRSSQTIWSHSSAG